MPEGLETKATCGPGHAGTTYHDDMYSFTENPIDPGGGRPVLSFHLTPLFSSYF
jgi:hypothetical protein